MKTPINLDNLKKGNSSLDVKYECSYTYKAIQQIKNGDDVFIVVGDELVPSYKSVILNHAIMLIDSRDELFCDEIPDDCNLTLEVLESVLVESKVVHFHDKDGYLKVRLTLNKSL